MHIYLLYIYSHLFSFVIFIMSILMHLVFSSWPSIPENRGELSLLAAALRGRSRYTLRRVGLGPLLGGFSALGGHFRYEDTG